VSNPTSSPTLIPPARDCTQPLVDLLTELSDCQGELEAAELTVNAALAALKADFAALLAGGRLLCTGGPTMTPAAQEILFCVVTRLEIGKVMDIVNNLDHGAFVVVFPLVPVAGPRGALPVKVETFTFR